MGFHELHFENLKSLVDWVENIRIIFKRSESSYCYTIFYPKCLILSDKWSILCSTYIVFFILYFVVKCKLYLLRSPARPAIYTIMDLVSNNCLVCYEWRLVLDFYRKYNEMITRKAVATKEEITIYLLTLFCMAYTGPDWLGHVYTARTLFTQLYYFLSRRAGGGRAPCQ